MPSKLNNYLVLQNTVQNITYSRLPTFMKIYCSFRVISVAYGAGIFQFPAKSLKQQAIATSVDEVALRGANVLGIERHYLSSFVSVSIFRKIKPETAAAPLCTGGSTVRTKVFQNKQDEDEVKTKSDRVSRHKMGADVNYNSR